MTKSRTAKRRDRRDRVQRGANLSLRMNGNPFIPKVVVNEEPFLDRQIRKKHLVPLVAGMEILERVAGFMARGEEEKLTLEIGVALNEGYSSGEVFDAMRLGIMNWENEMGLTISRERGR